MACGLRARILTPRLSTCTRTKRGEAASGKPRLARGQATETATEECLTTTAGTSSVWATFGTCPWARVEGLPAAIGLGGRSWEAGSSTEFGARPQDHPRLCMLTPATCDRLAITRRWTRSRRSRNWGAWDQIRVATGTTRRRSRLCLLSLTP